MTCRNDTADFSRKQHIKNAQILALNYTVCAIALQSAVTVSVVWVLSCAIWNQQPDALIIHILKCQASTTIKTLQRLWLKKNSLHSTFCYYSISWQASRSHSSLDQFTIFCSNFDTVWRERIIYSLFTNHFKKWYTLLLKFGSLRFFGQ